MPTVATPFSTRTHSWSLVKRNSLIGWSPCSFLSSLSSAAVVAMRHERKGGDLGRPRRAAHHRLDPRTRLGLAGGDIAHGDRSADAGTEAAGGDLADRRSAGAGQDGRCRGRALAL